MKVGGEEERVKRRENISGGNRDVGKKGGGKRKDNGRRR